LNLAGAIRALGAGARLRYGVVPVPSVLPRLVEVPDGRRTYVLLEDVIARHVAQLFRGMPIEGCWAFRVTRKLGPFHRRGRSEDLLVTIEREVRRRDRGSAVRLEIAAQAEQHLSDYLVRALKLGASDVYLIDGPLNIRTCCRCSPHRPEGAARTSRSRRSIRRPSATASAISSA